MGGGKSCSCNKMAFTQGWKCVKWCLIELLTLTDTKWNMPDLLANNELMAAIDIGSNSFHLAIARLDHGEVRKLASMSEKVQLAVALSADRRHDHHQSSARRLCCFSSTLGPTHTRQRFVPHWPSTSSDHSQTLQSHRDAFPTCI